MDPQWISSYWEQWSIGSYANSSLWATLVLQILWDLLEQLGGTRATLSLLNCAFFDAFLAVFLLYFVCTTVRKRWLNGTSRCIFPFYFLAFCPNASRDRVHWSLNRVDWFSEELSRTRIQPFLPTSLQTSNCLHCPPAIITSSTCNTHCPLVH